MKNFSIHFYNQDNCIDPDSIRNQTFQHQDLPIIFQHQVHANKGLAITEKNLEQYKKCLTHDSDYLITSLPNTGIGVLTADCLSIALADEKNNAIGIVHAGWRGTVGKIVINAINHMLQLYGSEPQNLYICFGPCALPCCYEIDQPFINQLPEWAKAAVKDNFFDLPKCNEILLQENGIQSEQIDRSACRCTICNDQFCSHRKNPSSKARQMSIIWLHS